MANVGILGLLGSKSLIKPPIKLLIPATIAPAKRPSGPIAAPPSKIVSPASTASQSRCPRGPSSAARRHRTQVGFRVARSERGGT